MVGNVILPDYETLSDQDKERIETLWAKVSHKEPLWFVEGCVGRNSYDIARHDFTYGIGSS